jgi:hypothetical protein
VTDFARQHPKVLIEQRVTNSMIDLIRGLADKREK